LAEQHDAEVDAAEDGIADKAAMAVVVAAALLRKISRP
jgi:hypothetical protein